MTTKELLDEYAVCYHHWKGYFGMEEDWARNENRCKQIIKELEASIRKEVVL